MTTDELLARLRGSKTDLERFVEIMLRDQLPELVVPANAVRAWQDLQPEVAELPLEPSRLGDRSAYFPQAAPRLRQPRQQVLRRRSRWAGWA